jgi:hypothetical protein
LSSNPTCISVIAWLHYIVLAGWNVGRAAYWFFLAAIRCKRRQAIDPGRVDVAG